MTAVGREKLFGLQVPHRLWQSLPGLPSGTEVAPLPTENVEIRIFMGIKVCQRRLGISTDGSQGKRK